MNIKKKEEADLYILIFIILSLGFTACGNFEQKASTTQQPRRQSGFKILSYEAYFQDSYQPSPRLTNTIHYDSGSGVAMITTNKYNSPANNANTQSISVPDTVRAELGKALDALDTSTLQDAYLPVGIGVRAGLLDGVAMKINLLGAIETKSVVIDTSNFEDVPPELLFLYDISLQKDYYFLGHRGQTLTKTKT